MSKSLSIRASGHLGDMIFTLAVLRNLGGKHDLILVDSPNIIGRFLPNVPLILDIIKAQPYVNSVSTVNQPANLDLTNFRRHIMQADNRTRTLMWSQTKEASELLGYEVPYDVSPWLTGIEAHSYSPGRIVIARSHRYRSRFMPWGKIVKHFGGRLLFVGLPEEHADFVEQFGWVEWFRTGTLMDVAMLMKSADLVIANQSSPHAVALGMGVPLVSEVSPQHPDCIFKRGNVQYVVDGSFKFEDFDSDGMTFDISHVNTDKIPPGRWQYRGEAFQSVEDGIRFFRRKDKGSDPETLRYEIIMENVNRLKGFFQGDIQTIVGGVWKEAFANAGIEMNDKAEPRPSKP